jgi:RecB family exonuclease
VTEARYFPFQAAVLLGCQEGSFPKALPQDELVDNYLKKAMGLPGWESLEAMEDQTFHLLKSRLPQLLLLRSLRLGEEMLQRSRFTESYLIKSGKKELAWPSAPLDSQAFTPEELTLTPEGAWSESGELLRTSMSASRLEHLIRCPYSFLLHALGVRGQEPPPAWGDSRREGEWLHAILEALITGKNRDKTILDPWPQESTERIAEEALQRLTHLSHLLAPPELRFSAFFTHLVETAWPKFAQHLANLWQGVPSYPAHREYKIETRGSQIAKVQVGSKERFLQGRIDAIDPGPHWMHVTDYKRRSPPALREGRDGSAPQLAFYALALQQLEPHWVARGLVFGYWNIAKGEWTAQAVSSQARGPAENAGFTKKDCPDMEDLTQDLLRIWQWREEELDAAGRYYADTSACKLCSYSGICRKEDPRVEALLKDQQRLAQYRKEVSSAD